MRTCTCGPVQADLCKRTCACGLVRTIGSFYDIWAISPMITVVLALATTGFTYMREVLLIALCLGYVRLSRRRSQRTIERMHTHADACRAHAIHSCA